MVDSLYKQKLNHATSIATSVSTPVSDSSGNLPVWDLSDLYADRQSPDLHKDIEAAKAKSLAFEAEWKGNLAS